MGQSAAKLNQCMEYGKEYKNTARKKAKLVMNPSRDRKPNRIRIVARVRSWSNSNTELNTGITHKGMFNISATILPRIGTFENPLHFAGRPKISYYVRHRPAELEGTDDVRFFSLAILLGNQPGTMNVRQQDYNGDNGTDR